MSHLENQHKCRDNDDHDKPQGLLLQLATAVLKAISIDNNYMTELQRNGSPKFADADDVNSELIGILATIEQDLQSGAISKKPKKP